MSYNKDEQLEEKSEFTEQQATEELVKRYGKAEEYINDADKIERFLQRLAKKVKVIPFVGKDLASITDLISLLRQYVKKEYVDIPIGSVIAITSALIYFVSPIDLIPDAVPIIGYGDDLLVIKACLKLVGTDVNEYNAWRRKNGIVFDDI